MQKKVITMLFMAVEDWRNSEISLPFGHVAGKRDFGQKMLFFLKVAKMGLKYNGTIENTKKKITALHKILPYCQKMTTGLISYTGFF